MLRRVLLGLGVVLLALGAFASWGAGRCLWDLRQVHIDVQPPARTAQEDHAWNPYWLELFAKLNASAAGVLLASGGIVLFVRRRCRR